MIRRAGPLVLLSALVWAAVGCSSDYVSSHAAQDAKKEALHKFAVEHGNPNREKRPD